MSAVANTPQTNPFPGLRPFREDEAHLFFGRENQVDAMVNKLAGTGFLAVVGTSGSGKSSLVNCGLRPALHQGLMARAGTAWRVAQFRPGSDPIGAMARALAQDGVLFRDHAAAGLSLAEIVETTLRMSKMGLIDICEQAALEEGVNLLVVVDQFEELFRYRHLSAAGHENAQRISDDAVAFVNLLLEVKEQARTCPIFVVLTMRSDFLGDCTQFPGLAEAINAGQYLTPRLTRDERRAAIERPVRVGGHDIASILVTRLVNDVGDNPDQLSILQHALNRTWAHWQNEGGGEGLLDLSHYQAIGTMAHALDRHAEKAFAELKGTRRQLICEKLFKALTDKATDPRGVRRPTPLGTLCALADATVAEVTEVMDRFRKPSRSFVMPPAGEVLEVETVIDISHESLMRVWQRLIRWADEEALSARTYCRLADTADLHALGKANLLRDPELQLALDWRETSRPNETWAARYHPGLGTAMRFLTESADAREVERTEREQQRRRERAAEQEKAEEKARSARRMAWWAWSMGAAAVVAVVFGVRAERLGVRAERLQFQAQESLSEVELLRWRLVADKSGQDPVMEILLALEFLPDAREKTNPGVDLAARTALASGIREFRELAVLDGHTDYVRGVAVTQDGTRIVTGSDDNTARVWDARTGAELLQLEGHTDYVRGVAVTPDGSRIVTGSDDKTARVWDARTGAELFELKGHTGYVRSVAVTPDGTRIVTGSDDNTARVWDARTGLTLRELRGHTGHVRAVAVTRDGAQIITGSDDKTARVWDAQTGLTLHELGGLRGHSDYVGGVAVTLDGAQIITGSDDKTARIWNARTGELEGVLAVPTGLAVASVAVTPDGTRIITGSADNTVRVWSPAANAQTWDVVLELRGHTGPVSGVAVTQDGTRIVSGSDDNTARIWDTAQERPPPPSVQERATLIERGKAVVPRCLTIEQRKTFSLGPTPPGWCIDMGKNPYDAKHWQAWKAGEELVDSTTAVEFGDFADAALRAGDFRMALEAAELGLKFDPSKLWIGINLAHAYMFLDRTEDARAEYLKLRGQEILFDSVLKKWDELVVDDFQSLREDGREHPLMNEIEEAFQR